MAGVITINKQIEYVKHKNIGFDEDHLLWLSLPVNYGHTQVLKNQLLQNPSIQQASISMGNPGNILHGTFGQDADGNSFPMSRIDVDDNFLNTLGIDLIQGRNFLGSDLGKSCLINETALRKYGWQNPEGKKFDGFDVIGIVRDFHVYSLHRQLNGVCLVFNSDRQTSMTLRIRPENVSATMKFIEDTWQTISPDSPFKYQFYDAWFDAMYRDEERLSKTIGMFSIIAFMQCMTL